MLAANTITAAKPSQSPVADTTCTIHNRKNSCDPNSRTCHPGLSLPASGYSVSVCSSGSSSRSGSPGWTPGGNEGETATSEADPAAARSRKEAMGSDSGSSAGARRVPSSSQFGSGRNTATMRTLERRAWALAPCEGQNGSSAEGPLPVAAASATA